MLKKLLTTILALAILVMPMAALAAGETGYVYFRVSDPKVSITDMMDLDMTGLEALLSMAYDMNDAENPIGTVTAQLLINGAESLSGAIGVDKEKAVGILNGMNSAYSVKLADVIPEYKFDPAIITQSFAYADNMKSFEKMELSDEELQQMREKYHIVEAGTEQIEFNGTTVEAKKYTMDWDKETYKEAIRYSLALFGIESEEIMSIYDEMEMIGQFTIYEIDEDNAKVTGAYTVEEEDGEKVDMTMDVVVYGQDENNMDMDMAMSAVTTDSEGTASDPIDMVMSMSVKEIEEFEDAVSLGMTMDMSQGGKRLAEMMFAIDPVKDDTSFTYEYNYEINVLDGSEDQETEGTIKVNGNSKFRDGAALFTMDMSAVDADSGEIMAVNFGMDGTYEKTGDDGVFRGPLSFSMQAEGEEVIGSVNLEMGFSEKVEGRLLDIDSIQAIDYASMTEGDFETASTELMTIVNSTVIELMNIPGLKQLIAAQMSTASYAE